MPQKTCLFLFFSTLGGWVGVSEASVEFSTLFFNPSLSPKTELTFWYYYPRKLKLLKSTSLVINPQIIQPSPVERLREFH